MAVGLSLELRVLWSDPWPLGAIPKIRATTLLKKQKYSKAGTMTRIGPLTGWERQESVRHTLRGRSAWDGTLDD